MYLSGIYWSPGRCAELYSASHFTGAEARVGLLLNIMKLLYFLNNDTFIRKNNIFMKIKGGAFTPTRKQARKREKKKESIWQNDAKGKNKD